MYRDTLFSSATHLKHSWIPILYLHSPSFLPLEFEWNGEQLLSDCSQEKRQDDLKERDLMQACKITSTVDKSKQRVTMFTCFWYKKQGTSDETNRCCKWTKMPPDTMGSYSVQLLAAKHCSHRHFIWVQKGTRLADGRKHWLRTVMCKDETSASGSPKLDIAGSQGSILRGKKKLRKYIFAFTTRTVIPIFLQRRVATWQSLLYLFCTTVLVCRLKISQDCIRKYCAQMKLLFFK